MKWMRQALLTRTNSICMQIKFLILTLLCLLTACEGAPNAAKPMNWVFKHMPEDAPPTYKSGWQDGCESGLTVKTNDFYRTFYRLKQDVNLIHDPYYYNAWKSSFDYCRTYAYGMLKEANLRGGQPEKGGGIPKPVGVLQLLDNMGPGITSRW